VAVSDRLKLNWPPCETEGLALLAHGTSGTCPRTLVAKRVDVRVRRGRGSSVDGCGVERTFGVPKSPKLHAGDTYEPIVERRFLCFVSLSPLDKEMKSVVVQWSWTPQKGIIL